MDTSSITYNYGIARGLYDSQNMKVIDIEIIKLIYSQIDLVLAYYNNPVAAMEQLNLIKTVFFKDALNEQGQIGIPLIKIRGVYNQVQTIQELKNSFIPSLNFREKMTMLKNFVSKTNDCIMYSIIIEYNAAVNNSQESAFITKYPMLNTDGLKKTIIQIENILGFEIEETDSCYNDIEGSAQTKCTRTTKPYYNLIQDTYMDSPTESPITICWLWHPLVYGIPYQDVIKLQSNNLVKQIATSYTTVTNPTQATQCMERIYSQYPLFPKLSEREKLYMKKNNIFANIDSLYQLPPYRPPVCFQQPIQPNSFYVNLQKKYKKYNVSNLSGHVMIYITMAKLFNNINLDLIILANIVYMVPYNHSIHEVLQASKLLGINTEYSIRDTDIDAVNTILGNNGLRPITISSSASWIPPTSITRTPSSGGRKRRKTNKSKRKSNKRIKNTRKNKLRKRKNKL